MFSVALPSNKGRLYQKQVYRASLFYPECALALGDTASAQGVEVRFVVTKQFQVFQASSPGQQVVGDVQHVVGLVVGQMDLEQFQVTVDRLIEPELTDQQVDSSDAAMGGRSRAITDVVVDVRGGHDRPVGSPVIVLVQALCDPPLALSATVRIGTSLSAVVGLVCRGLGTTREASSGDRARVGLL